MKRKFVKATLYLFVLAVPILTIIVYIGSETYPISIVVGKVRKVVWPKKPINLEESKTIILESGLSIPLPNPRIEVFKSERILHIYNEDELVESFEIGLGQNPEGHKAREGDSRTPEGEYYICTRLNPSTYHLFLGLSYPAPVDILQESTLSETQIQNINQAFESETKPPWDTPLGGAVGIHGGGASDWTAGCVTLANTDIEMIYLLTENGTPVTIFP